MGQIELFIIIIIIGYLKQYSGMQVVHLIFVRTPPTHTPGRIYHEFF